MGKRRQREEPCHICNHFHDVRRAREREKERERRRSLFSMLIYFFLSFSSTSSSVFHKITVRGRRALSYLRPQARIPGENDSGSRQWWWLCCERRRRRSSCSCSGSRGNDSNRNNSKGLGPSRERSPGRDRPRRVLRFLRQCSEERAAARARDHAHS